MDSYSHGVNKDHLESAKRARRERKRVYRLSQQPEDMNVKKEKEEKKKKEEEEDDDANLDIQDESMEDASDTSVSGGSIKGTVLGVTQGFALIERLNNKFEIVHRKDLDPDDYDNWDTKEPINPREDLDRAKTLKKTGRFGEVRELETLTYASPSGKRRQCVIAKHRERVLRLAKSEYDKLFGEQQRTPCPSSRKAVHTGAKPANSESSQNVRFSAQRSLGQGLVASTTSVGTILGKWGEKHYAIATGTNNNPVLAIEACEAIDPASYNGQKNISLDLKNINRSFEDVRQSKDDFRNKWELIEAAKYPHGKTFYCVVWIRERTTGAPRRDSKIIEPSGAFLTKTLYVQLSGDKGGVEKKERGSPLKEGYNRTVNADGEIVSVECGQSVPMKTGVSRDTTKKQAQGQTKVSSKTISGMPSRFYIVARQLRRGVVSKYPQKPENVRHLVKNEQDIYESRIGKELMEEQAKGNIECIDLDMGCGYNPLSDRAWVECLSKLGATDIEVLGIVGHMLKTTPIVTVIFRPRNNALEKSLKKHRSQAHGDIEKYDYEGPVRCSWSTFKKKATEDQKKEALNLLRDTDPDLYAVILERASTPPSSRFRSRSRSQTPGVSQELENDIVKVFEKAAAGALKVLTKYSIHEGDSGYES